MSARLKRWHEDLNARMFVPGQYLREYSAELSRLSGGKRLHLGCGDGTTLGAYAVVPSGTIALDLDRAVLSRSRSECRVVGDAIKLPFLTGSIDVAHAEHVLEHIRDPSALMAEIGRVLRPGGRFVFVTPNAWSYVALGARLVPVRFRRRLIETMTGRISSEENHPTYYRANTARTLRRLLTRNGLEVRRLDGFVSEPCYTTAIPFIHVAAVGWHCALERCHLERVAGLTLLGVAGKPEVLPCAE